MRFTTDMATATTKTSALPCVVRALFARAAIGTKIAPPPPRVSPCRSVRYVGLPVCLIMGLMLIFPVAADATPTRTTFLEFGSGTITYNDGVNFAATANPATTNILNSVEGWKWYKTAADGYAANTLILNGLHLAITSTNHYALGLSDGSGITTTIILEGSNTITATDNGAIIGILSNGGYVTIKGNGSLTVTTNNTSPSSYSYGISIHSTGSGLTIESGTIHVTASGGKDAAYGLSSSEALTINGGTVTASGDTRAIANNYTVPSGYHYYVSTTTTPSTAQLTGNGSTTIIGSSHKWAQIIAQSTPPTGLPNLTAAATWMYILIALSLGLWGYVGCSYVVSRRKS